MSCPMLISLRRAFFNGLPSLGMMRMTFASKSMSFHSTKNDSVGRVPVFDATSADRNGDTPLHFAAAKGDVALIDELVSRGAKVDARNDGGVIPLTVAIITRQKGSMERLIGHGAQVNAAEDSGIPSPLSVAIEKDFPEGVELLVRLGARTDARGEHGNTPLHVAIGTGQTGMLATLASASNVNVQNDEGETPLHLAVAKGNEGFVGLLLRKGANANVRDDRTWMPLHLAIKARNDGIANILVLHGANVNANGSNNVTPMHEAALFDCREAMGRLMEAKADINSLDKDGYTPLDYAVASRSTNAVALLNSKQAYSKIRTIVTCKSCGSSRTCHRCSGWKQISCPMCRGTGRGTQGSGKDITPFCPACGGKAKVTCPECGGSGTCPKCSAAAEKGVLEKERRQLLDGLPLELRECASSGMRKDSKSP